MMLKMGVAPGFVNLIMLCFSTMKCYVAANGNLLGPCVSERGSRQEGPLSHFLFIIGAEGCLNQRL